MMLFSGFQVYRGGWYLWRRLAVHWGGLREAESHENWGWATLRWPLTLQHRYWGLSTDPGGGWILMEVVTSRVIACSALIRPSVIQRETRDPQHAHWVDAIRRADGHPSLTGAVPQLPERVGSVDLCVPPLDFWGGVTYYVTVQLKGVACELSLRQRWLHKARCWWWWFRGAACPK